MINCPKCNHLTLDRDNRSRSWVCLRKECLFCATDIFEKSGEKSNLKKPSVVIEIRNGSLVGAYTNADMEIILVDYDEIAGGSSAAIVPDPTCDLPLETKRLAADAVERRCLIKS